MKKNSNKKLFISLIVFSIALSLFSLVFFNLESDYLWHVKAGEYMFNNGVVNYDVFSWVVKSKYWMSHEWLFELLIYLLKKLFGNYHLFIYCFFSITSLSLILLFSNRKNYLKNSIFTLIWLLFFLFIIPFVQVRPHLFSYILLALVFYFLYDLYMNEDSKKVYFVPLLSILWSNIHGGSSNLPYLLCLLFIGCGLFEFKFSKIEAVRFSKNQFKKFVIVMLLSMVCVSINIHGIKMFFYPYLNMMDSTMLNNISEWQGTSLNSLSGYLYFSFLLFNILVLLFSKRKIQLLDFIVFGFFTFLGIKSIRFWFFNYIVMSYIIFNYISPRKEDSGTTIGIILISLLMISGFVLRSNNIFSPKYHYLLDSKIIRKLKEEKPERLFNMYDYGGELVYWDIPVFIDGRADLYGKYNYKDYLRISVLDKETDKLLKKYDFDYLLVSKSYPIYLYLDGENSYDLIFDNNKYALYKKN